MQKVIDNILAELCYQQKHATQIEVVEILPQKTLKFEGRVFKRVLFWVVPACVMCNQRALLLKVFELIEAEPQALFCFQFNDILLNLNCTMNLL